MTTQAEPTQADALGAAFLRDQIASMKDDGFIPRDEAKENTDGYIRELLSHFPANPDVEAEHEDCYSHSFGHYTKPAGLTASTGFNLGPVEIVVSSYNGEDADIEIICADPVDGEDSLFEEWREIIANSDQAAALTKASVR